MAQYNHMTAEERILLQNLLTQNKTLSQIAAIMKRDISTIRNEVLKHRHESTKGAFGKSFNNCIHRIKCQYKGSCEHCPRDKCSWCNVCNSYCSHYIPDTCKHRDTKTRCCNGCSSISKCTLLKYFYDASTAHKEYLKTLSESRKGINITEEELAQLNAIMTDRVKNKGQSINSLVTNEPDIINVCAKTLYNYTALGVLQTKNIDLARKVRLSPRKGKPNHKVDRNCTIGRTYDDFIKFMEENPGTDVSEIDSVEGKKGQSCLLTVFFRSCTVQLSYKRESNNARSVQEVFDDIYLKVGHEKFTELFPVILADNGSEFSNPEAIENYIHVDEETGEIIKTPRTKLFYCDPSAPYQKGACERNHEFIRYFIPKGESFDPYTQEDIDLMMNHINSYTREKKNLKSPTLRFIYLYGEDTADKLGIVPIEPADVTLNKSIFKK